MNDDDFSRWEDVEAEAREARERESDAVAAAGGPQVPGWHDTPASTGGPATPAPPVEEAPLTAAAPPPVPEGPSVLLADSDPLGRQRLAQALEAAGWRTRVAIDGPEALIELYRDRPDCFVLDLALDGLSGLDLLRRVVDDGVVEDLLVVVHSSRSESWQVHQARAMGVARFLERDVDRPEALVDAVGEQLARRGLVEPTADDRPEPSAAEQAADGTVSAGGFKSPFGTGGGPPGSVPAAVKRAAVSREPEVKSGIFGS